MRTVGRLCRIHGKVTFGIDMNIKIINTDSELLNALRHSTDVKMTSTQALEQRVSYVYGAMKSDSDITREQVKKVIAEQK